MNTAFTLRTLTKLAPISSNPGLDHSGRNKSDSVAYALRWWKDKLKYFDVKDTLDAKDVWTIIIA
jgi:hypothetical protein